MSQYRITSRDIVPEGETGDPDAFLSNEDRLSLGLPLNPTRSLNAVSSTSDTPSKKLGDTQFRMPGPRSMQVKK